MMICEKPVVTGVAGAPAAFGSGPGMWAQCQPDTPDASSSGGGENQGKDGERRAGCVP